MPQVQVLDVLCKHMFFHPEISGTVTQDVLGLGRLMQNDCFLLRNCLCIVLAQVRSVRSVLVALVVLVDSLKGSAAVGRSISPSMIICFRPIRQLSLQMLWQIIVDFATRALRGRLPMGGH